MSAKKLDELKFYAPVYDSSIKDYPACLGYHNIFNNIRVRENIALYKLTDRYKEYEERCRKEGRTPDWAFWVFSPFWSRFQYESGFGDGDLNKKEKEVLQKASEEDAKQIFFKEIPYGEPFQDDRGWRFVKTDIYSLVIKPNEELIRAMVDGISKESCRIVLKEFRNRQRERARLIREHRARMKEEQGE